MMTSMPWVKVYVEILDDVKLARLTEAQRWRFIELILLAAECDAEGALVTGDSPMTIKDVTWRLRCDEKSLANDIDRMIESGLLHHEHGMIVVSKFAERQGPTQAEKRKVWRERQKQHRERAKQAIVTQESSVTGFDVTGVEEEEEEEREEEREEEEEKTSAATNSFQLYESNIGLLTPMISDDLIAIEKDFPMEWIEAAFKEAVNNNKRSLSYIKAILTRWGRDGFKVDTRPKRNGKNAPGDQDPRRYITGEFAEFIEH